MREFDLVVLGGGSGGIATANRAAEHGAKVAIIEVSHLGGTCVNQGCVPKKVSWYAAHINDAIQKYGPGYGFEVDHLTFDYATFLKARDGYVERSRAGYVNRFNANKVEYIAGYGVLKNNHEIEVNDELIKAKYIVLATGGHPEIPDVKGAEYLETSNDFFAWKDLPGSVAVVGAGYIAVELAGVMHSLGVKSHLVVRFDRPLRSFDRMLSDGIVEAFETDGPQLITHTSFDEYRKNEAGQIECYQKGELRLTVDRVIMAVGRQPNTDKIGLENTKVRLTPKGHIDVDDQHQTAEANIYAVGDVIGKIDLTPVAIKAGRQVAEYLFNHASSAGIDYTNVPSVVFTHPAIGTVGLTQEEAIEKYGEEQIKIYTNKFYSMYASAAWHREPCYFKLVCLGDNQQVIGLHGIGEGVDEMIQGFAVAIKMGATKAQFDSVVAIHPTGAEEFVTMR
ncbi:glutathione-disulfide reductase [Fundicoccus culcitae]|uniref:Glutathione-disulfide reductase n=1 Tax=Fundicoccus culcitae TaxID=2969821 RepID=A0ABY5P613_9LACT|nr:glutathione-disulfide reductase [Fundicoccus culcitae]UUX33838.1 glutathione-disulfide reductase [Fundicoccus culcitae]